MAWDLRSSTAWSASSAAWWRQTTAPMAVPASAFVYPRSPRRKQHEFAHDVVLANRFEPAALVLAVEKALAERSLRQELATLRLSRVENENIVARSESMRAVMGVVEQIAPTAVSVLITGPSGVGKEVVARAIHARSE